MSLTGIVGGLFAFYLGVMALLYMGQRHLLYLSEQNLGTPAAYGVPEMETLTTTTEDGLILSHWYAPPRTKGDNPTIVLFHGNAGHLGYRAFKARFFLEQGFGVLLVGYRGYGGNPGTPTEEGLYQDARSALQFLNGKGVGLDSIVLYGESLGTGVAVQMALEGRGGAIVLEAAYSNLSAAAAHHYRIFPVRRLLKDRFDSLSKVPSINLPLLQFHGEKDRVIPIGLGRKLYQFYGGTKAFVAFPKASHNDLYDFGGGKAVVKFLSENKRSFKSR